MDLQGAMNFSLRRMEHELKPDLHYHSLNHTIDVHHAAKRLCMMEQTSEHDQLLIETAALFHDAGMLERYNDHEAASSHLAQRILPGFGYNGADIEQINKLIMVTCLPQQALSLNEQIICDADLDYLGRDDFFIHSFQLQLEWRLFGVKETNLKEWLILQAEFLTTHHYFTISACRLRDGKKTDNLAEILTLIQK